MNVPSYLYLIENEDQTAFKIGVGNFVKNPKSDRIKAHVRYKWRVLEVVCRLDHPATEQTPWGKAVSKKAQEGRGWFTWVFATEDNSKVEEKFGRSAIEGHRTKPDGKDLAWKQIGVLGTLEDKQLPFFIEWLSLDHPSTDGKAIAKIVKVEISGDESRIEEWLGSELRAAIGSDVEVEWVAAAASEGESGIVAVHVMTPSGVVRLD